MDVVHWSFIRSSNLPGRIVAVGGVQVPVMGEENEREITREEVKSNGMEYVIWAKGPALGGGEEGID